MKTLHNVPRTTLLVVCAAGLLSLAACNRSEPGGNMPASNNSPSVAMTPNTPTPSTSSTSSASSTSPMASSSSMSDSDLNITSRVNESLRQDDMLRSHSIDVSTTDGDVRLRGEVDSQAQREHALVVARAVTGVRDVQDELTLKR